MKITTLITNKFVLVCVLAFGFSLNVTSQVITYNFESDAANATPANITVVNGTIKVDTDALRTNTISPQTSPSGKPATFDLDLFPKAKDYSITWKETYSTAGVTCFTLRGFGKFVTPNQYQGYGFQVNAAAGKLTILRFDSTNFATVKSVNLTAPGVAVARWYRATVDGALLTFEYSDDNITFTTLISTIEDVYPSSGFTELTRGYLSPIAGTFVDDVVFTPITTATKVYDFESDTAGSTPANVTAANGTITIDSNAGRTNTMKVLTVASGDTAAFNLDSAPSSSDYTVIWKENFSAAGRTGMLLRASGANSANTGVKQGYLFEASASEGKLRISKSNAAGYEMLSEVALAARGNNLNRWYRAVANGSSLSFEYSDNGRDFVTATMPSATDATYTLGGTQFLNGFGTTVTNSYIDNIVFTPLNGSSLKTVSRVTSRFNIFPNPATNNVNIALNDSVKGAFTVSIYNVLGEIVKEYNFDGQSNVSIDVSSIHSGIYFLKVKTVSQVQTQKLIIN